MSEDFTNLMLLLNDYFSEPAAVPRLREGGARRGERGPSALRRAAAAVPPALGREGGVSLLRKGGRFL